MRGFLIILALLGLVIGGGYAVREYAPQYLPDQWTTDEVLTQRMRAGLQEDALADAFFTKFELLFPADYNEIMTQLVALHRRGGSKEEADRFGENYMRSFIQDNQRYIANAEPEVLVSLTRALLAGAQALRAENPTQCGEIYRSGGGMNLPVEGMSPPTRDAFLNITLAMLDGIASGKRARTNYEAPNQAQSLAFIGRYQALGGDMAALEASASSDIYGLSAETVCATVEHTWAAVLQAEDDFAPRFISLSIRARGATVVQ